MNHQKNKPPLWKIAVAAVSIVFILVLWGYKDFGALPPGEMIPLVALNAVVSLFKIAAVAGVLLAMKWLAEKFGKK